MVDKAPRPIISINIWILSSDTICQLHQSFSNSEAALLSIKETKEAPITLRSFKKNKKIGISYIIFMLNIYSFPSFSNNLLFNQLKFILSINSVFTFKHESPRGGQLLKSL